MDHCDLVHDILIVTLSFCIFSWGGFILLAFLSRFVSVEVFPLIRGERGMLDSYSPSSKTNCILQPCFHIWEVFNVDARKCVV